MQTMFSVTQKYLVWQCNTTDFLYKLDDLCNDTFCVNTVYFYSAMHTLTQSHLIHISIVSYGQKFPLKGDSLLVASLWSQLTVNNKDMPHPCLCPAYVKVPIFIAQVT